MALHEIGNVSIHNGGGFVVRMQFKYTNEDGNVETSEHGGDVTLGFTQKIDPGVLGVPDGSPVILNAIVVWGKDNEAQQEFMYIKDNQVTAAYTITGTTLNNTLGFIGFQE